MSDQPQMECPQCGDDAVPKPATARTRAADSQPAGRPPAKPADTIGAQYMRRLIAGLAPAPHPPAGRRDPGREAGS